MKKSLGAKTLAYPTPVFLVGSYDKDGKPNVMTAAWGGICCSSPPCVAISLRKATYTYGNIMEKRAFTISIPSESQVREADYFGLASGKREDKFAATGFTAVRSDNVDAPYVKECPLIIECKVIQITEIGLHTQFIGEVLDVKADEECLTAEGNPDIEKIKPFSYAPGPNWYYGISALLGRAFSIGKQIQGK
jgi:flavin reductase (DIM6/NTAB) family NADH-FMN oxidoreductase RutF